MKVGIIGMGNMGFAIYQQIRKDVNKMVVYEKNKEKLELYDVSATSPDEKVELDYIIIAVKPGDIVMLRNLKWTGTIISLAAGISMATLKDVFPESPVIRLMPNTPLLIGEGVSGVYFQEKFPEAEKKRALEFIEKFSRTVVVEKEGLIDAITAISGSGPAYGYLFLEAMGDAGVRCGLSRKDAYDLAAQTLIGAAKMVQQTAQHPGELKDQVTSPAGTTIEAIAALEKNGFRNAVHEAVQAAFLKAKNMK
jgi:pyrroline-5-carboxylate reductase